jgi:large repetitive protein
MNARDLAAAGRKVSTRNTSIVAVWAATLALGGCGGPASSPSPDVTQCHDGGLAGAPITLAPASVAATPAGASVTVAVSGTFADPNGNLPFKFFASDTIFWNGSANGVGTAYVDSSHLTMTVPGNLLSSTGSLAQVTVQEKCGSGPNPTSHSNSAGLKITLGIMTTSLPNAALLGAYNQQLSAAGGAAPYTWSIASGSLPAGLALSPAGVISGIATVAGTANFTVHVADSSSKQKIPSNTETATQALSITVSAGVVPVTITKGFLLPNGTVGIAYNQTVTAAGGKTPYKWSWMAAPGTKLPPGLNISSASGAITGTPTTAGNFEVVVQVQDSSAPNPEADSKQLSLIINNPQHIVYAPGPVVSSNGPGLLVAIDQGNNAAESNTGVAVVAIKGMTIPAGGNFASIWVRDISGNWPKVPAAQLAAPAGVTGTVPSIAVSGDGDTIVAGFCPGSPCGTSVAYVYTTSHNAWNGNLTPTATLTGDPNRGVSPDGAIGFSVAVDRSGDTIVAGGPVELTQNGPGIVAVFLKPPGGWASKSDDAQLTANVPDVGVSVGIDAAGDTIVAGAEPFGSFVTAGAAFVFVKPTQGVWAGLISAPAATLAQSNPAVGDYFGRSIAISADGHTVVVGAPNYSCAAQQHCNIGGPGAAFVFFNNLGPSNWATLASQKAPKPLTETAKLMASNGNSGDQFGETTAISTNGNVIVAGAPAVNAAAPHPGAVYVFEMAGAAWSGTPQATQNLAATATPTVIPLSQFGASVAIAGDATSLGAGGFATVSGTVGAQVVYLFQ